MIEEVILPESVQLAPQDWRRIGEPFRQAQGPEPAEVAQILVSKYCDHLPLYRQEAIYWSRHQVWLPRQRMAEWVGLAAEWLQPIYNLIRNEVCGRGYVQVDEPSGAR